MDKNISITDSMVKEFLTEMVNYDGYAPEFISRWEEFKGRYSGCGGEGKKDWEVLEFDVIQSSGLAPANYILRADGLYHAIWGNPKSFDSLIGHPWISIHSVRRLSDGGVFSIGDKITDGKVKKIFIRNINPESTIKQCWIGTSKHNDDGSDLMYAEKVPIPPPKPMLITEDGKELFANDNYWWVDILHGYEMQGATVCPYSDPSTYNSSYKKFSTERLAKDYIVLNRPCLSVKDVQSVYSDSRSFVGTQFLIDGLKALAQSKIKGG